MKSFIIIAIGMISLGLNAQTVSSLKNIHPAEAASLQKKIMNDEVGAQINALTTIVQAGGFADVGRPVPVDCNRLNAVLQVAKMAPRTYLELPDARITTPEQVEQLTALIQQASQTIVEAKRLAQENSCAKVNNKCCDSSDPIEDKCAAAEELDCNAPRSVCSSSSDACPDDDE